MSEYPVTAAVRTLRAAMATFVPHLYEYVERGGTATSSAALGVAEHEVIKTLVFEDDAKKPIVVLMHGDREVSAKALARHLGVKMVKPCAPDVADRHSGYRVGGTSPFGLKKPMPIYMQHTIGALPRIYINGGARGFLVEIDPALLTSILGAEPVDVATAS